MLASNPLIQVTPGLMIWTIICFLITFFVLKKLAFGRIQAAHIPYRVPTEAEEAIRGLPGPS